MNRRGGGKKKQIGTRVLKMKDKLTSCENGQNRVSTAKRQFSTTGEGGEEPDFTELNHIKRIRTE